MYVTFVRRMKLQSMQLDQMPREPVRPVAQPVAVERAGQAEKHFVASIHLVMTSIDNFADKPHYVN